MAAASGRLSAQAVGAKVRYAAVILLLLVYLFPIYWIVTMAFKLPKDTFAYPPVFVFQPTLENFAMAFGKSNFLRLTLNSTIAALGNTFLSIAIGSLAAWGISRHRIGGRWLLLGVLSVRMIPAMTIIIPLFLLFVQFRLVDSYLTLPLAYLAMNLPFVIWTMKAFIDDIPYDIEESAIIDGCSTLGLLCKIVLPLALPGLVATSIFCFIFAWNELILATVLTRLTARTAVVGLTTFISQEAEINWGALSAAALVVMTPPLALAVALRNYLLRGLTAGALK